MKPFLIRTLRSLLRLLARLTLLRYRPAVIAVTGSVGKTSTKLAIASVIGSQLSVRVSRMNFNNELGVPLVILGDYERISGIFFWPKVIGNAVLRLVLMKPYPDVVILEYGIDHPGDMKYLLSIARPNVGVLTAIGDVPVHVEFFSGPDAVAREKARLIESHPAAGFAILNYDNDIVMGLRERTRAHAVTFGFGEAADVRLSDFSHEIKEERPVGIRFTVSYAGLDTSIALPGVIGRAQSYAIGAAVATGLAFGISFQKIMASLSNYRPADSRMELLAGQKDSLILNDAYNASPLSMRAALETLDELPAKRRIAVLGDMRELGTYALAAHESLGREAARVADALITIGPHGKLIAAGALSAKMRKDKVRAYESWEEAVLPLQELLRPGDVVLVKASHSIHLEELVEGIRAFER